MISSLTLHSWLMLRKRRGRGGVGSDIIVELALVVDATQETGSGWGGE